MSFHHMCGLDEAVHSRLVKSTGNLCFYPDVLWFLRELIRFFLLPQFVSTA